jgi:hypothetical protein
MDENGQKINNVDNVSWSNEGFSKPTSNRWA